jgi:uncharacterized protein (TIGR03435 family)
MIKVILGIAVAAIAAFAQKPPAFDVASVKLSTSFTGGFSMGTKNGRLTATNVPVKTLILKGFHAKDFQVTGGPGWLETERYDVVAKTENTSIGDNDLWLLLQPLLEERFRLRFHKETKQMPVYSLVVAKGGSKLKRHTGDDEPTMSGRMSGGKASLACTNTSMARLADALGEHTDRLVLDDTRLKGSYDFKLDWSQDHPGEPASVSMLNGLEEGLGLTGPSIFTAVQEQLGLKLEPAKGPVQIIVIDGADKASGN